MKTNPCKLTAALLGVILAVTVSARAELLFYEGFDYAAGSLAGMNGGDGFGAAWVNSKNTTTVTGGLQFGDLSVSGGAATGNNTQSTRTLSAAIDANSAIVTGGGTLYISFLLLETAVSYNNLSFFNGTERLSIGNIYTGSAPSNNYGFATSNMGNGTGTGQTYSSALIDTSGATHLFVMQLDYSTPGQTALSLYMDPTISGLGAAIATQTIGATLTFDGIRLELTNGLIDELRVATTLTEALPGLMQIPEPSAWALMLSGGVLLALLWSADILVGGRRQECRRSMG